MKIKIKRLFHGYATVRDYQAIKAFEKGEDLYIELHHKVMRIPNNEIMGGSVSGGVITSKHVQGMKYMLIDYPWKETEEQIPLF